MVGVYSETMLNWVASSDVGSKKKIGPVRAGFFADFINWCQSIRQANPTDDVEILKKGKKRKRHNLE